MMLVGLACVLIGGLLGVLTEWLLGDLYNQMIQATVRMNELSSAQPLPGGFRFDATKYAVPARGLWIFVGLNFGLLAGIIVMLVLGGFAYIQHAMLRLALYRGGYTPWNYVSFLDYCAERIFLRRVGGGYIFVHRLLMEYFAGLDGHERSAGGTEL